MNKFIHILSFSMFSFPNIFGSNWLVSSSNGNENDSIINQNDNQNKCLINQQDMSLYKFSPTDLYNLADDLTDLRDRPGGLMPGIVKSIGTGQDRYGVKKYESDIKGLSKEMVAGLYEMCEGKQEILPHEIKLVRNDKEEPKDKYLDRFKSTLLKWINDESQIYGRDFQGIRLSGIMKILKEKIEDLESGDEVGWKSLIVEVYNGNIKVCSPNELREQQEKEYKENLNNRAMDNLTTGAISLTNLFVRFINNYLPNREQVINTFHLDSVDHYNTINFSIWHNTYPVYNEAMTSFILEKIEYLINEQIMSEDMEEIMYHYDEMKRNIGTLMTRIKDNCMLHTIQVPKFIKS